MSEAKEKPTPNWPTEERAVAPPRFTKRFSAILAMVLRLLWRSALAIPMPVSEIFGVWSCLLGLRVMCSSLPKSSLLMFKLSYWILYTVSDLWEISSPQENLFVGVEAVEDGDISFIIMAFWLRNAWPSQWNVTGVLRPLQSFDFYNLSVSLRLEQVFALFWSFS